jgi:hypothetical protein
LNPAIWSGDGILLVVHPVEQDEQDDGQCAEDNGEYNHPRPVRLLAVPPAATAIAITLVSSRTPAGSHAT